MIKIIVMIIKDQEGKFLIFKRSAHRKSYPNKWNFASAHLEKGEMPKECALREIREELGDDIELKFIKLGRAFIDNQPDGDWMVHPLLFEYEGGNIEIEAEHTEYNWVTLEELKEMDTVPGILLDLEYLDK